MVKKIILRDIQILILHYLFDVQERGNLFLILKAQGYSKMHTKGYFNVIKRDPSSVETYVNFASDL